jgi:hypothetical protein
MMIKTMVELLLGSNLVQNNIFRFVTTFFQMKTSLLACKWHHIDPKVIIWFSREPFIENP